MITIFQSKVPKPFDEKYYIYIFRGSGLNYLGAEVYIISLICKKRRTISESIVVL